MTNYYQHNGTNYVHVSDYAALEARLAEAEEKRTKQLRQQGDAWAADAARYKARLAEVAANAPWLTQAHILCSDHGIPPGNISDRLSLLRIRLAELPEKLAEAEAERDTLLETQRKFGSMMHEQMDKLDEAEDAIERAGRCLAMSNKGAAEALAILMVYKQADSADLVPAPDGSRVLVVNEGLRELQRESEDLGMYDSASAKLAAAGYTKRDTRLQCDECGKWFTPQLLPAHKCAADQPEPAT